MATGQNGQTGRSAIIHVERKCHFVLEIAQILNHNMVDILVMALAAKINHVQKTKLFHLAGMFAK